MCNMCHHVVWYIYQVEGVVGVVQKIRSDDFRDKFVGASLICVDGKVG